MEINLASPPASAMARLDYSRFNGLGDSDSEDGDKTQEVTWIPNGGPFCEGL